jgi:hypothetical protein
MSNVNRNEQVHFGSLQDQSANIDGVYFPIVGSTSAVFRLSCPCFFSCRLEGWFTNGVLQRIK